MRGSLLLNALAITYVSSQTLTPNCNYAGDATHFYPIGGCVRRSQGSYKYICDAFGDVRKLQYSGGECHGSATNVPVTSDLQSYECDLGACVYSEQCDLEGCEQEDCSDCISNPGGFDRVCLPWIQDECTGNVGGLLIMDECANDTNVQSYWFSESDCAGDSAFSLPAFDGDCSGNRYYEVQCDIVAPPGPKRAGPGERPEAASVFSDMEREIMDYESKDVDGAKYFNVFGFKGSLLDLILISSNFVFVMIFLCMICAKCCSKKTKGQYKRAHRDEAKPILNDDLYNSV